MLQNTRKISQIPIWWHQSKIQNIFWQQFLPCRIGNEFFIFPVEGFQFSKFHENEAIHDKRNFKRGLTVTFNVKNLKNCWCSKFFVFLFIYLFFWVGKKPNYLKIFLNITEITKFGENIKFGKGLLLSSWKGSYNENNQNVAWKVCRHLVIHRNTLTCNNICNTSKTTSYYVISDW